MAVICEQAAEDLEEGEKNSDRAPKGTHAQVLMSSAVVGGSQILNIGIGIVRTKAMAVLLGPAGFGLFGLYTSVQNLMQTFAGMGVNSSGVREIAAAVSSSDSKCVAETALVLRRVSVLLGTIGAGLMVLLSRQISELTFGTAQRAADVAWLSIAVFLTLVSSSQVALIQGMRKIADLAKIQVFGALFGAVFGIPLVYFLGQRGVVPSLICVALSTILTSWWYSRRISTAGYAVSKMSISQVRQAAGALLRLGFAFMLSSLITLGVAYAIRITILHRLGFEATGCYQSAWTLGGLYVGFILQAMGADFYPRLTAHANDSKECNRLVNEQAQVGILLAGPGVIATLTLASLVITFLYSSKFGGAVPILRWICVGTFLQVISWPMGFIIIAKAKRTLFVACEMAWGLVSIALAYVCISYFGVVGTGIAFCASYAFHTLMLYAVVSRLSGFRWSKENWTVGSISFLMLTIVFTGFYLLPTIYSVSIGIAATIIHLVYSMRTFTSLVAPEQLPAPVVRLMSIVGLQFRGART